MRTLVISANFFACLKLETGRIPGMISTSIPAETQRSWRNAGSFPHQRRTSNGQFAPAIHFTLQVKEVSLSAFASDALPGTRHGISKIGNVFQQRDQIRRIHFGLTATRRRSPRRATI